VPLSGYEFASEGPAPPANASTAWRTSDSSNQTKAIIKPKNTIKLSSAENAALIAVAFTYEKTTSHETNVVEHCAYRQSAPLLGM
jgi:hypothetical protein